MNLGLIITAVAVLTFTIFGTSNGQSTEPYANCITFRLPPQTVTLAITEDCDEQEFTEAIDHYKANGYPIEGMYLNFGDSKSIELRSQQYADDVKKMEAED